MPPPKPRCARGHDDTQRIAELDGVSLRLGQRGVDPGLAQVHDGDDRCAGGNHFALAGSADVDPAADRGKDLRITQLDFGLLG